MEALYLWLAEAGGHQASGAHIQIPLLAAVIIGVQRRDASVQRADDHQSPAERGGESLRLRSTHY